MCELDCGVSVEIIKDRMRRGLTGEALIKPVDGPKNYKIDKKKAQEIWKDVIRESKKLNRKVSVSEKIARKHKVSRHIVDNIRFGNTWNDVTGLVKKYYSKAG